MGLKERLSDVLKGLERQFAALPAEGLKAARAAFAECFKPTGQFRELEDGRKVEKVNVDLQPLKDAVKGDLRQDLNVADRALSNEISLRGEAFGSEGAHLALKEHLPSLSATPSKK